MNVSDPIVWTNPTTGKELRGVYVAAYGRWSIIEAVMETGRLGLRYVHPSDIKPTESPL